MQWLDAFDDDIWNALERGEALRIESVVNVPSFLKYTEMAAEFGPLMGARSVARPSAI